MRASTASSIAIVGGGASGTIMAAHLLRMGSPALWVTLIEKRDAFGEGLAYSTSLPEHLLNVSAMGMSALADDPEHFQRWIVRQGLSEGETHPHYVPRSVFGRYLRELLEELSASKPGRLTLINATVEAVTPVPSGVDIRLENGASIAVHRAVIAAGHDEEPAPQQNFALRIGSAEDTALDRDAPILILGSGLSMVDAWLTLEHRGHRGPICAISRRGLLPSAHHAGHPIRLDSADIPLGTGLSYVVRWFRDLVHATERAGGNWRDVVDGIRPFNQRIWQSWSVDSKRRFLQHTKAWWDIHRHRMPPVIHGRLSAAVREGRLRLLAGRVMGVERRGETFHVTFQRRQAQATERMDVARIYDCTGIVKDVSAGSIKVVRSLTDRGYARADPLRLGIDVTVDCKVFDAAGQVSGKLYAVGPLTRGTFFEIDAVPDIRAQCARLARLLTTAQPGN